MRRQLIYFYEELDKLKDTIVSFLTLLLFSSFKTAHIVSKLKREDKINCFILGNGPSLKDVFHNEIRKQELLNSDCIVTNRFANSDLFGIVKPKYYLLLDPAFSDKDAINKDQTIKSIYENLHLISWKMILFVKNGDDCKEISKRIDNPQISIVKYNATKIVGYNWFQNICYKRNLGIPSSRNVIISALQLMINFGYKVIYLYGADFSWTKTIDVDPQNNRVFLNNTHFYSNNEIIYQDKGWYCSYLKYVAEMLDGLYQIEKYANYMAVKIINRTKGSYIDAFEYENPDNLSN